MPSDLNGASGREQRYVIGEEIASGGMATVHLGRMIGDAGFARTVAVKRLHPQYAKDPEFSAMLLDEGRLASRIQHVNVVPTLDVVARGGELFMVMEYVHGEPLNRLLRAVVRARARVPARVAAGIMAGALRGLHAAHEATDARGRSLGVVHRDVSPQNIIVGSDGVPRVLDFGIAKAAGRAHTTQTGQIKGKFAYMAPEQLHGEELDRRADIYAAGVVLWESLVGARLFTGVDQQSPNLAKLLDPQIDPPSARAPELGAAYDAVTLRALARDKEARFATALEMAEALEACEPVASAAEIGTWVLATAGEVLAERARHIAAAERELAQRIRDSGEYLEQVEATITEVRDLPSREEITRTRQSRRPPLARPAIAEPAAPPDRRGALVWIALALLGSALVVGTATLVGRSGAASAPMVTASAPAVTASAISPVESVASAAAPEPAPIASVIAPTASAVAPAASVIAPAVSARPASTPSKPKARPPEASCAPPFTIDAAGHKHYKPECLR